MRPNKALHRTAASPGARLALGCFPFRFHVGVHPRAAVGELGRSATRHRCRASAPPCGVAALVRVAGEKGPVEIRAVECVRL